MLYLNSYSTHIIVVSNHLCIWILWWKMPSKLEMSYIRGVSDPDLIFMWTLEFWGGMCAPDKWLHFWHISNRSTEYYLFFVNFAICNIISWATTRNEQKKEFIIASEGGAPLWVHFLLELKFSIGIGHGFEWAHSHSQRGQLRRYDV